MRSLAVATIISLIAALIAGYIALDSKRFDFADYAFIGAIAVFLILFVMLLAYKAARSFGTSRPALDDEVGRSMQKL